MPLNIYERRVKSFPERVFTFDSLASILDYFTKHYHALPIRCSSWQTIFWVTVLTISGIKKGVSKSIKNAHTKYIGVLYCLHHHYLRNYHDSAPLPLPPPTNTSTLPLPLPHATIIIIISTTCTFAESGHWPTTTTTTTITPSQSQPHSPSLRPPPPPPPQAHQPLPHPHISYGCYKGLRLQSRGSQVAIRVLHLKKGYWTFNNFTISAVVGSVSRFSVLVMK